MFYKEAVVNGVLCWRDKPDGEWKVIPASELTRRLLLAEGKLDEIRKVVEKKTLGYLVEKIGEDVKRFNKTLKKAASQGKPFAEGLVERLEGGRSIG